MTLRKGCIGLGLLAAGFFSSATYAQTPQFLPGPQTKPKEQSKKLDRLYQASEWYLSAGTALDMTSTIALLGHPTVAHKADGTVLGRFYGVETGWAGPIVGRRNTTGVVFANVILNVAVSRLSRNLYRRGGHWRLLAIGLNLCKATGNTTAGISNLNFNVNQKMRVATGYGGRISWSQ